MSSPLARAHILGEKRLRDGTVGALERIWRGLPAYDRGNMDQWLSEALPVVEAAQRRSAALTNAYLARSLERQPVGLDLSELIGAGVRNGTVPAEVYARPFVNVWTALGNETPWKQAVEDGMARATGSAAMDVQLSMRATANAVQATDSSIYGYARVADATACEFCQTVNGAYVKRADAMPLHNHCGCGLEALTDVHRGAVFLPDGTQAREYAYGPKSPVAVHEHGELGPVLTDPNDHFTGAGDLAHAH